MVLEVTDLVFYSDTMTEQGSNIFPGMFRQKDEICGGDLGGVGAEYCPLAHVGSLGGVVLEEANSFALVCEGAKHRI